MRLEFTKENLISSLIYFQQYFDLESSDYCLINGGAMCIRDLRHTAHIDLICSDIAKDKIVQKLNIVKSELIQFTLNEIPFEIKSNVFRKIDLEDNVLINDERYVDNVDGIRSLKLEILLLFKTRRTRHVDFKDITLIEEFSKDHAFDWKFFLQLSRKANAIKSLTVNKRNIFIRLFSLMLKPNDAFKIILDILDSYYMYIDKILSRNTDLDTKNQLITYVPTAKVLQWQLISSSEGIIFNRLDLGLRALVVDTITNSDNRKTNEIHLMYKKMQNQRSGKDTADLSKFIRLVESILKRGFSPYNPIVLNSSGRLYDGAHRLSVAMALGIPLVPIRMSSFNNKLKQKLFDKKIEKIEFSEKWFHSFGFSKNKIAELESRVKVAFFETGLYFPVIVWPPAMSHFDQIIKELDKKFDLISQLILDLNKDSFQAFLYEIYETDDIAFWKIGAKLAAMEGFLSAQNQIGIVYIDILNPRYRRKGKGGIISQEVEESKKIIRGLIAPQIDNYFYDIILHIGDNYYQSHEIHKRIVKYTK